MEKVSIFFGRVEYIMYIVAFGTFCGHLGNLVVPSRFAKRRFAKRRFAKNPNAAFCRKPSSLNDF
jgi:hypothetical protein